jgi:CheY-like chemotaxis protein
MHAQAESISRRQPVEPTVLIVEDERVSRRALALLLAASGYRAAAYESAEAALAGVDGGPPPDVALVDVDLPGMSGLDFVSKLEERLPGTKAVLLTAAAGERNDRFRREHRGDYLRKPVDFPRLLMLLTRSGGLH